MKVVCVYIYVYMRIYIYVYVIWSLVVIYILNHPILNTLSYQDLLLCRVPENSISERKKRFAQKKRFNVYTLNPKPLDP